MQSTSLKSSGSLKITLAAAALLLVPLTSPLRADVGQDNRAPDVPPILQVPDGNKVCFHAYAVGVQIYTWKNISSTDVPQFAWVFKAPEAVLFDSDGNVVGLHYVGPTWETESGSKVLGAVDKRSPSPVGSIAWLLLHAVATQGPGILDQVTYVQRVNTAGGTAPSTGLDPSHEGEEVRVPYTAEYYFYRATH